jgi:predicted ATPase
VALDNCEHHEDGCASVVNAIAAAQGAATVLVTSRQILAVDGECVLAVAPLPPDAAVELFIDRAQLVTTASSPDVTGIERLCRRLDHLPLAIELAAAQMRVVDADELDARLDDRFLLLPRRAGPSAHHESMAAAIAWWRIGTAHVGAVRCS